MEGAEAKAYYGLAVNYRVLEALVERLLVKETLTGNEVHTSPHPAFREFLASSLSASPLLWSATCSFQPHLPSSLLARCTYDVCLPVIYSTGPWCVLWNIVKRMLECGLKGCTDPLQVREIASEAALQPFPDPYVEGFAFDAEGQIVYPGMQVQVRLPLVTTHLALLASICKWDSQGRPSPLCQLLLLAPYALAGVVRPAPCRQLLQISALRVLCLQAIASLMWKASTLQTGTCAPCTCVIQYNYIVSHQTMTCRHALSVGAAQARDLTAEGAPAVPLKPRRTRGEDAEAMLNGAHPLSPYRVRLDLLDIMIPELKV